MSEIVLLQVPAFMAKLYRHGNHALNPFSSLIRIYLYQALLTD